MSDLVSVVMSTYNRNDLLFGRALKSVAAQTYQNIEVHLVADGMIGPELTELGKRTMELDFTPLRGKFTLWNIPRQTYPDDASKWSVLGMNARNHALDHARGEWVAPLDDDDEWTEDHIEVLLAAAKGGFAAAKGGFDFAYGMSQYHWPDERPQTAGRWPPGYGAFCDGAQLYRNGMGYRYDPGCIERGLPEDGDMWERMVAGGVTFTFIPQLVHHYFPNPR